jgi:hypothetical protein
MARVLRGQRYEGARKGAGHRSDRVAVQGCRSGQERQACGRRRGREGNFFRVELERSGWVWPCGEEAKSFLLGVETKGLLRTADVVDRRVQEADT